MVSGCRPALRLPGGVSCANQKQQGLSAGELPGSWHAKQHSFASTAAAAGLGREGHHAAAANVQNTSLG